MTAISINNSQVIESLKILEQSQKVSFPYSVKEFGLDLIVHRNVFPPKYFNGFKIFTDKIPEFQGKDVLEIGSGTGVTGLYLAKNGARKVIMVDFMEEALNNTIDNAKRNHIDNVEIRESDILNSIHESEKFDIIYWNIPWVPIDPDYKLKTKLEASLFDPGYESTQRLFKEAKKHLKDGGRFIIGWGDSDDEIKEFGDPEVLEEFAQIYGYEMKLIYKEASFEQNPVYFLLFEFTPRE